MQATPPPAGLSYYQNGTNHTFYASPEICAECHDGVTAPVVEAEDVQVPVETALHELQGRIEGKILDVMGAQFALGRTVALDSTTLTDLSEIADLVLTDAQGRLAIEVALSGGGSAGPTGLNSVNVREGDATVAALYQLLDPRLLKGGWNWAVIESDGSKGVHNPSFVTATLDASIAAVQAVPEPGAGAAAVAVLAGLAGLAIRQRAG